MLAVLDRLAGEEFEFVALAPESGPLADALAKRGIRHVPFHFHDKEGHRLPRNAVCRNLLSAVRVVSPQLVHANSLSMGRITGAIASEFSVPTVAHLRDILTLSRAAVADLNRNRRLIAVSQATRDFHVEQGFDSDRTQVLYNGVDCDRFFPRSTTGELKQELGLPEDAFLVVTIGQIGLRKGQDVLAEAAILAGDRLPAVHYLLVGERHSTKRESIEFEQNLISRFEEAGLGNRLHRLGNRNGVHRLMNEADLLVHPAHQEPLGRVLLEAAAAGLPMIATTVGGTAEIVEDGRSARLIPPGNPHALAEAMIELRFDNQRRKQLALNARHRMETTFSISRAATALKQLWQEILHLNDN